MRVRLTIGLLLASLVSLSMMQPSAARGEKRVVKFRVLCLEHLEGVRTAKISSGKGSGSLEVPLLTGDFGEQLEATFTKEDVTFFVKDPEAEDGHRVVATGKLASGKQQVFLLLPDSPRKTTYRILAMNDDEKSFPMGGVRVLNLCKTPIRLDLSGTEQKPIEPGKLALYPPMKKADEWGMYQVRLDISAPNGKWYPFARPSWKMSDLKRDLVVVRLDPGSKQPHASYYKDIPPWRKPKLGGE